MISLEFARVDCVMGWVRKFFDLFPRPGRDTMTSGLTLVREKSDRSKHGQGQVCPATARSDKKEKGPADDLHFDLKQNLDLH